MIILKRCVTFLLPLLMVGCSSAPPEVHTSRPLIENARTTNSLNTIPKDLSQAFESRMVGQKVNHNGTIYILGRKYMSALGNQCRKIISSTEYGVSPSNQKKQLGYKSIACKIENQEWGIVPQISE